jgi:aryl-alcohol dehydrogenase-like predicted oxidoreductase
MMEKRKLGASGLTVSALGLGTMGMSGSPGKAGMYGIADQREAILTIHRALDLGIDFFDTAEVYGPYVNEELLAKALMGRRHQAVIATKFGFKIAADGSIQGVNGSPANANKALEASLKRLNTDHIDLWYLHRLDKTVPIEETVGAMSEAVKQGKVRYLGLSEVGVKTLERAQAVHPISALQSEYSLWERNIEADVLPAARRLSIGIVPFCPLGRGFLTGKIQSAEELPVEDYRRTDPRYQGGNFDLNRRIVDAVTAIAQKKNMTAAQIALAWLLHQGRDIVPIPGTKRRQYLEENAGAARAVLTAEDLAALQAAAPKGAAAGPRYSPAHMATVDR